MQRQSSYKVHLNMISNGELSDALCDSVNRGQIGILGFTKLQVYDLTPY